MKQAASHRSSTARRDAGGDGTAAIVASPPLADLGAIRAPVLLLNGEHDLVLLP